MIVFVMCAVLGVLGWVAGVHDKHIEPARIGLNLRPAAREIVGRDLWLGTQIHASVRKLSRLITQVLHECRSNALAAVHVINPQGRDPRGILRPRIEITLNEERRPEIGPALMRDNRERNARTCDHRIKMRPVIHQRNPTLHPPRMPPAMRNGISEVGMGTEGGDGHVTAASKFQPRTLEII